jgi:hypothetical protein
LDGQIDAMKKSINKLLRTQNANVCVGTLALAELILLAAQERNVPSKA